MSVRARENASFSVSASEKERERERERRCETVLDMCIAADNNNDDDGFTTERVGQCLGSVRDAFF